MGFADPLALLLAALLGVLVWLYFWEQRRREVAVPSLLLWQTLREDTVRTERFRPDLLFLLQALALACLILGLAKPYFERSPGTTSTARQILVLDTSASMKARESGATRWSLAREKALQTLRDLPPGTEVMLITAADTPEVLLPFTRDRGELERALGQLEPTDTGGDLAVALAFADGAGTRSDLPTSVTVYTDRPSSDLPPAVRSRVHVTQVGSSDDNVAIESLQVFQGRFQDPRSASLEVRLRNYSAQDRHGLLTLQLEDRVLMQTGFTLQPHGVQSFTSANLPGPGRVVARIATDDAFALDDTAFAWIRPLRPLRLLVVSPSPQWAAALAEVAKATPGLQVSQQTPGTPWPSEPVDVALFYRTAPTDAPRSNALYVYPPADAVGLTALGEATAADILDWNSRHPIVNLLRPVTVEPFARAHVVTPPPGSQVLLSSRSGAREFPLAFATEQSGRRAVYLMFDLDAEQLLDNDNLGLFLFFLNSLAWLAPERDDTVILRTGEAYAIEGTPAPMVDVRDPSGGKRTLASAPLSLTPRQAGEYRLRFEGGERTLLVNFADAAESDIGRKPERASTAAFASVGVPPATPGPPPPGFGRWLYVAGLVLLLAEWLVASRRRA